MFNFEIFYKYFYHTGIPDILFFTIDKGLEKLLSEKELSNISV